MNQVVIDALNFVYSYASHIDDWLTIKKELLKTLPSHERTAFSSRDPITKKQRTNDFELQLAKRWSDLSGRTVIISKDEHASI
jgi:hypothetical protein